MLQQTNEPQIEPTETPARLNSLWIASQVAIIGIFVLLFGAFLQSARVLVLPIICAVVIGIMLSPMARRAATSRLPGPTLSVLAVSLFFVLIQFALAAVVAPILAVAAHATEVGENLRQKFAILHPLIERLRSFESSIMPGTPSPLDSVDAGVPKIDLANTLQPVAAFLTPAVGEILIFLATLLLFLVSREALRRNAILWFSGSEARLRAIRMLNEVEDNLVRYVGTVAVINAVLGFLTALGTFFLGFPGPILLGALAFLCAFVPYIGAAFMAVVLFCVGLASFPGWHEALIATALYVGMVTCEGYFITPNIVGMRFTLNPLSVFLSLVFWTWLWGPLGGFLSVPLLIVGVAAVDHLLSDTETELPS